MAQKLFSTGSGIFRTAERKEAIDGLDRTTCDSLRCNVLMTVTTPLQEIPLKIKTFLNLPSVCNYDAIGFD